MHVKGRFFDGKSAEGHDVIARFSGYGLTIEYAETGRFIENWAADDAMPIFQSADGQRIDWTHRQDKDARLMLREEGLKYRLEAAYPGILPQEPGEWTGAFKVSFWLMGGATAVLFAVFLMAEMIVLRFPAEWEREMGRTLAESYVLEKTMGGAYCETPKANAALQKLEDRLMTGFDARHPLDIKIINSSAINAFALPGGYIRIYSGLIDKLENPDTLAGILAHEIGHVEQQHSLKSLSRSLLILATAEAITGGTGVSTFLIDLSNLRNSRSMEREADQFAIDRLKAVGLDPADTADFFKILIDQGLTVEAGDLFQLMQTHPQSSERLEILKAASAPRASPSLTDDEWQALKQVCTDA